MGDINIVVRHCAGRKEKMIWINSVLPDGLDQLALKNILFTVILIIVNRAEVCIKA